MALKQVSWYIDIPTLKEFEVLIKVLGQKKSEAFRRAVKDYIIKHTTANNTKRQISEVQAKQLEELLHSIKRK